MSRERAQQLVEAGIWLKLSGDREGARKLFERALKLDPSNEKAAQLLSGTEPDAPPPGPAALPEPPPPPPPIAPVASANPFEPPANVPPAANELDWGMATGYASTTPLPQVAPPVPPVIDPRAPKQTMVWGTPAAPRTTMQQWGADKPRQTLPGWGVPDELKEASAAWSAGQQTISLSGDVPAETPPPSTPPLFSAPPPEPEAPPVPPTSTPSAVFGALEPPAPQTVELTGQTEPEPPPPSTPPIFGAVPGAGSDLGFAWSWSASAPNPEPIPEPRPSPSLVPAAESAWDARSNPGIKLEAVTGQDRALDLISSDSKITNPGLARKEEINVILRGAKDLLELDDHTGAMELITRAQQLAPDDPDVIAMRERSEKTLLAMFESKLGKLDTVPRVLLKDDEIIWLNLDHRAGFVLAQIDGTVSFDDLFSVSGMSRIDTARILAQLVEEGVISRG
ncbi:MAG: tetratricopeptide repeat protein [Myxococcota bacterium]